MRLAVAAAFLALAALAPSEARPQGLFGPGFGAVPAFAWTRADPATGAIRWEGDYARVSSGFEVSSSRRFGTSGGPTFGVEAGRLWREGDMLWGVAAALDVLAPFGAVASPGWGQASWTRDFAGGVWAKAGVFVAEDVLVYAKLGVLGLNEKLRFGPGPLGPGFSRDDVVLRPDARVGVEWAITDRLSVGFELGAARTIR